MPAQAAEHRGAGVNESSSFHFVEHRESGTSECHIMVKPVGGKYRRYIQLSKTEACKLARAVRDRWACSECGIIPTELHKEGCSQR